MRVAVMGAGGVGGYIGGLLAGAGNDVYLIARGEHLRAIRDRGLSIEGIKDTSVNFMIPATDDPSDIGPVDLVIFSVKSYDTEFSARRLSPVIGNRTVCLSLQNGIDNEERIGSIIGMERVMGGVAYLSSHIVRPGVVKVSERIRRLTIGELDGSISQRGNDIRDIFESAGIPCELSDDIQKALWEKFLFVCAMGGMTAVTRMPIGPIRGFPPTLDMGISIMMEVKEVGDALSIKLDDDTVERMVALLNSFPSDTVSSLLLDLAMGRTSEIDALNGKVVELGDAHSIPTPANRFVYACIKVQEREVKNSRIFCPSCHSMIPIGAIYCHRCGIAIEEKKEEESEERIPCADESCIGIIGPSGRCGICGRRPEEIIG